MPDRDLLPVEVVGRLLRVTAVVSPVDSRVSVRAVPLVGFHYRPGVTSSAVCVCDDWQSCGDDLRAGSADVVADFDRYAAYLDQERRAGRLVGLSRGEE